MKKRYILFLIIQLFWSLLSCALTFISEISSVSKTPESFFILGSIVLGTIVFIALQPFLVNQKTSSKASMILVVGYILLFVASRKLFMNRASLFAALCLILSIAGILMYSISDKALSANLSKNILSKVAFFLLLFFSLVCSVCGNITLICCSDREVHYKIIDIIMLLIIIAASILLFFSKNQSAGMIHLCALVMSGLSFESTFMYILLLLIIAELFTLTGKFCIYTSN